MSLLTDAKGRFAETLVSTLLEYAGYRVLRLGVEETVSEVKAGLARREQSLQLPDQLRTAPDFLVVDPRSGSCTLLEVKFRRTFDDAVARELHGVLTRQVAFWPETVTVVVCAAVPIEASGADVRAHVRCLRADDLSRLIEPHPHLSKWQRLRMLGGVFDAVAEAEGIYRESEQLVAPIRAWA